MYLYFDASALVKRYVVEPGRTILDELFHLVTFERLYLSYWTVTEIVSVLVRKRNRGDLASGEMSAAMSRLLAETARMQEEPVDRDDAHASIRFIIQHSLNATDALHLFVALRIRELLSEAVVMVSADRRLLRAADAEGLITLDPESGTLSDVRHLLQVP